MLEQNGGLRIEPIFLKTVNLGGCENGPIHLR